MTDLVITKSAALKLIKKWELFWNFPKTPEGQDALASAFMKIAGTVENSEWLSDQVINGFSRCPTPIELRKLYSTRRGAPADGKHEREYDATEFMAGEKHK